MTEHARYEIIECTVTGHATYGLLVESQSGERGYVDREYINDSGSEHTAWPGVGEAILGAVLGYTKDGRLRISTQPSYIDLIRTSTDIHGILDAWVRVRKTDK
jgi:hypothetical protein